MVACCFAPAPRIRKFLRLFEMTHRSRPSKKVERPDVDLTERQIAEFRESFAHFDRNGDRYISIRELKEVIEKLGFRPTIEQLRGFMEEADSDKNGKVDFDEFLCVMKGRMGEMLHLDELEKAFKVFDYNNDGRISRGELRGVFKSLEQHFTEDQIGEMIKVADKDADGYIDFDEFSGLIDSFK